MATTACELRILSHNLFFLYEWMHSLGQSTRAQLIAGSDYIRGHDALFFQEAFDPKPRRILQELLKDEYPYQTGVVGETLQGWDTSTGSFSKSPAVDNGGVFIMSKWPIVFQQQHVFKDACGLERFENKGFVYAKIMYKEKHPIHLINTHLQSNDPISNFHQWTRVRASQLTEIRDFVAQSGIPQDELVIIGGDLNVNKPDDVVVPTSSTTITNTTAGELPYSESRRLEYLSMVHQHLVVKEPEYKGCPHTWDCIENSIVEHIWPKMSPMHFDYLFVAKSHATCVRSFEVETLLVRPNEPFEVPRWSCCLRSTWTLQDYSDHFPIRASIRADL